MNESLGLDVALLLGGAIVLIGVSLALRSLLDLVPLSKARREALARATPVLAVLLGLLYSVFAVGILFQDQPHLMPIVVLLLLAGFVVASWGALRDMLAGAFLRAGRVLDRGDQVRIDGLSGRIKRMGYRVLILETLDGDEAIVPYSTIARERLIRTPTVEGVAAHVFTLHLPAGISLADAKQTIRKSALLVHWSAPARAPEITSAGDDRLEVTVYAVHPDRGPDIESAVRHALG